MAKRKTAGQVVDFTVTFRTLRLKKRSLSTHTNLPRGVLAVDCNLRGLTSLVESLLRARKYPKYFSHVV